MISHSSSATPLVRVIVALLMSLGPSAFAAPVTTGAGPIEPSARAPSAAGADAYRPAGSAPPAEGPARAAWQEARAQLQDGALDAAEAGFRKAAGLDPKSYAPVLGLADVALRRGDLAAAATLTAQAGKLAPQSADVATAAGRVAAGQRRAADAEREFKRAIQLDPKYVVPRLDLADLLLAMSRPAEAVDAYKAAAAADPRHAGAAFGLGRALVARRDLAGAQRAFEQSAQLAPDQAAPKLALAEVLAAQKRHPEALAAVDAVLRQQPENLQARTVRAGVLRSQGRLDDAIAEQQRVVAATQGSAAAAALVQLGTLQEAASRPAEADTSYRKALQADPKFHVAWNNVAWLAVVRNAGLDRALSDIGRALELSPGNPVYLDTLGSIELALGHPAQAVEAWRKATQAAPRAPALQFRLGQALEKQGQPAAAASAYQAALAMKQPFEGEAVARQRVAALQGTPAR